MSNTLLNISGKIDSKTIALYQILVELAEELGIPMVVVGASARDMVLHYGYGAKVQRATLDVNFGVQVSDWNAFDLLKRQLLERGFKPTGAEHRLINQADVQVDIVPFGNLEDEAANIAWPTKGEWVMNVLGFQEVCDNADMVRIQNDPPVDIPVATPEGMSILKLIAWTDRSPDLRTKDAKDLLYLLTTYDKIPANSERLYEDQELMEIYDWDITLAAAHLLGINAKSIAKDQTSTAIMKLFRSEHEKLSVEFLVEQMCEHIENEYVNNEFLMQAYMSGFSAK
jgi:predicted nucleotidyltransferase